MLKWDFDNPNSSRYFSPNNQSLEKTGWVLMAGQDYYLKPWEEVTDSHGIMREHWDMLREANFKPYRTFNTKAGFVLISDPTYEFCWHIAANNLTGRYRGEVIRRIKTKIRRKLNQRKAAKMKKRGWELDLFSTFLSRKHSYHKMVGKQRYVKIKKD